MKHINLEICLYLLTAFISIALVAFLAAKRVETRQRVSVDAYDVGCSAEHGEWVCRDNAWVVVGTVSAHDLAERGCHIDDALMCCHAQETATVVAERRLAECLDTLRLCARVTARYEAGAQVCRGEK